MAPSRITTTKFQRQASPRRSEPGRLTEQHPEHQTGSERDRHGEDEAREGAFGSSLGKTGQGANQRGKAG